MILLVFENVWKRYSAEYILREISLSVGSGETVLVTGPNGSGKTTMLRLGIGLLRPSKGKIYVNGIDVRLPKAKMMLGYLPHTPPLYLDLTVRENLRYYASLYGHDEIPKHVVEAAEGFGLNKYMDRRVRELSYGWRKRVDILRAMIGSPRVLLMDEPFSGLDVQGRRFLISLIRELTGKGCSTLFTAPLGYEVPMSVDKKVEIKGGYLVELKS